MPYAQIGERFSSEVSFSKSQIAEFARLSGDHNPLHHDEALAQQSRFGSIIASGPQTAAHFMGVTASYFSQQGVALGLDFQIRFRRAAYPDELLRTEWVVTEVEFNAKLGGEIVRLEGTMTNPKGEAVLLGSGTVLVTDKL